MAETDILAEEFVIANFNVTVQMNYSELSIMEERGGVCSLNRVSCLQRAMSV